MTVTKRRVATEWRVYIDGRPTQINISKAGAPRYREPQMYDVMCGDDDWLFEAKSVGRAMAIIETLVQEFAR